MPGCLEPPSLQALGPERASMALFSPACAAAREPKRSISRSSETGRDNAEGADKDEGRKDLVACQAISSRPEAARLDKTGGSPASSA